MKKKYTINWENDKVVSVEINGVKYKDPDQIPDPEDQARIMLLMSDGTDTELSLPTSDPVFKLIIPVLVVIGIFMLMIAGLTAANTWRAISREVSAPGQVVDLVTRMDSTGAVFYYPVVEFSLPDGSHKTVQISEGSWPPAYASGQAVTVLYDAQQPLQARIKSTSGTINMWTWSIITRILGLAFVIIPLFVHRVFQLKLEPADG